MTVAENIAYPLQARGLPKAEIASEDEACSNGRAGRLRRPLSVHELSGGQQQRVALAGR